MSTRSNYLWATADKVGGIALAFLFNLIMARWFLTPREFGLIGMLQIFISLGYTTTIAGFGQTIVQAKTLDRNDINTIFTTNVLIALLVYVLLFFLAPYVASFYQEPTLKDILRVLGLQPIICSFFIIQYNLALRATELKKLCIITLGSNILGYAIGVILAMNGAGVWSLVMATLSIYLLQNIGLWITSNIYPHIGVSKSSFQKLIPYSSFIYFATIVEQVYSQGLALILGKQYSASTVGYYTQANKLQQVPSTAIQDIGYQVLFPKLSGLYGSGEELNDQYRRNSRLVIAIGTLAFSILFVVAKPAVLILFSDKWAASIPMLRILTSVGLFLILSYLPTILIRAIGDAKGYFYLSLAEKIGGLAVIVGLSFISLTTTLWGLVGINIASYIVNIIYVSRVSTITFREQLSDGLSLLLPQCLATLGIDFFLSYIYIPNEWILLLSGIIATTSVFIVLTMLTKYVDIKRLFRLVVK